MMNVTASEWYSNFWGGMNDEVISSHTFITAFHIFYMFRTHQGYYERTDEYEPILRRHWQSSFQVANVHSVILVNLRHEDSRKLSFRPPPEGCKQVPYL